MSSNQNNSNEEQNKVPSNKQDESADTPLPALEEQQTNPPDTSTIILQPTPPMEVHAHSHTPRKKWTHYFWEFLMLFSAVTLGFFVENQREHYIEDKRAREYAVLMVEDLKKDTALYSDIIKWMEMHIQGFDTVSALFKQSPAVSDARLIKAVLTQRSTYRVPLFPTTFNQMKSSGSLRYFRNNEISSKVSSYYDIFHSAIKSSFDYNDDFFKDELQTFMLNHFDYTESSYFGDSLLVSNPTYLERSMKTDILLRNRLVFILP